MLGQRTGGSTRPPRKSCSRKVPSRSGSGGRRASFWVQGRLVALPYIPPHAVTRLAGGKRGAGEIQAAGRGPLLFQA